MDSSEQTRFDALYAQHLRTLKLQGKAAATIDSYARAVRRVSAYFDRCPDRMDAEEFKGRYLFNAFALAKVFRAKLLRALHEAGVAIPPGLPSKWGVDCRRVGHGEPALKYLSRYLYSRGDRRA